VTSLDPEAALRLFLCTVAVVGIVYVWSGSGMMQKSNSGWWNDLPQGKRVVFVLAVAATIAQAFM
jgi:hypothetical protein